MLTRCKVHVQFLRAFHAQRVFHLVRNAVGIHEMDIHALRHVARSHDIESVRVGQDVFCLCLFFVLFVLLALLRVRRLILCGRLPVAAHHGVHQHRCSALFARFAHKLREVVVKRRTWVGMAVSLGLLVIVSELDDDVVARFDEREHLVPAFLVDETLGRTSVDGVVVHAHEGGVEVALQHHGPAAFRRTLREILVGSGRVTDDKNRRHVVGLEGAHHGEHDGQCRPFSDSFHSHCISSSVCF